MSGAPEWGPPDFADAMPPKPANQGGHDSVHMQAPMTSSPPRTRMSMASPTHINLAERSTTPAPVGGSFMPPKSGAGSNSGYGSEERSNAA